jgi:tetratricopeptide (TPR) repeat protein
MNEAVELFNKAKTCAEAGDSLRALRLAQQAIQKYDGYEDAWLLIGSLSPYVEERISALEKARSLNPTNQQTVALLKEARQLRDDPLGAAAHYEQVGNFDQALKVYNELATRTKDSREFDRIYRQIVRIEGLQKENIHYVAPQSSILRLTFGWPLLYLFLVLVQVGLNPFAHPAFLLWLGLPLVVVGSFLLSISEVRSKHVFWQTVFSEEGEGSNFARLVTAIAGWLLVIFPHLFLLIDSINRLRIFRIPPGPF